MSLPALGFLIFRGALGHLQIHLSLVARFGTMVETVVAAPYVGAMLSFAAHPVEASISRPFVTVLPALTGRADAINVSASA